VTARSLRAQIAPATKQREEDIADSSARLPTIISDCARTSTTITHALTDAA
jgi:hypothetical protein